MMKIVIVDDDRAAADALAQKLSTFDETQLCIIRKTKRFAFP